MLHWLPTPAVENNHQQRSSLSSMLPHQVLNTSFFPLPGASEFHGRIPGENSRGEFVTPESAKTTLESQPVSLKKRIIQEIRKFNIF
jgi:hypothetical protein